MFWVLLYLGVGALNVAHAVVQGTLMIRDDRHGLVPSLLEVAFYLLFWWVQLGFWILTTVHNLTTGVLERIFR